MKTRIDKDTWLRKDHYDFFSRFEEPFFGVTVTVDVAHAFHYAKQKTHSFFLHYLYRALKAANSIENFRYRIIDGDVYLFDEIHASPTINRANGTFGFAYMDFHDDENVFIAGARKIVEEVRHSSGLIPAVSGENVIHFSAMPWLKFTAVSHARSFNFPDSCPKISFGQVYEDNGQLLMPVSIHLHHGLADGYHAGLFVERFQELLNEAI